MNRTVMIRFDQDQDHLFCQEGFAPVVLVHIKLKSLKVRIKQCVCDSTLCVIALVLYQNFVFFQSLTDRLLSMKAWDSDLEEADEGAEKEPSNGTAERMDEVGKGDSGYTQHHLQKVQKLIYAAKVICDLMTC